MSITQTLRPVTVYRGGKELITTPFTPDSVRTRNSRSNSGGRTTEIRTSINDKFKFFNHHYNKLAKDHNESIHDTMSPKNNNI